LKVFAEINELDTNNVAYLKCLNVEHGKSSDQCKWFSKLVLKQLMQVKSKDV